MTLFLWGTGAVEAAQQFGAQGLAVEMLRDAGFKIFAEEDIDEAEAYLASLQED